MFLFGFLRIHKFPPVQKNTMCSTAFLTVRRPGPEDIMLSIIMLFILISLIITWETIEYNAINRLLTVYRALTFLLPSCKIKPQIHSVKSGWGNSSLLLSRFVLYGWEAVKQLSVLFLCLKFFRIFYKQGR